MLQERIFARLLIESKLDSLSNNVGKNLMRAIVPNVKSFNSKEGSNGFKIETTSDGEDDIDVELNLKFINRDGRTSLGGSYDSKEKKLYIDVTVGSSDGKIHNKHLNDIQTRLYNVIRHELEHYVQSNNEQHSGSLDVAYKKYRKWDKDKTNVDKLEKYFTSEAEIPAFTSGIYNFAKKTRRPYKEVQDEYLDNINNKMMLQYEKLNQNPEDIEVYRSTLANAIQNVKKQWNDYSRKRFPKAIID